MKHITLIFVLSFLPHLAFSSLHKPTLPDSLYWLRAMTDEVSMVKNPQESILQCINELDAICKESNNLYAEQRPQAATLCRRIIRLGLLENAGYPTLNYIRLLKQLSEIFKEVNDTIICSALEMESNRLNYERIIKEITRKEETREDYVLHSLSYSIKFDEGLSLLWAINYLFGRHGQGTNYEIELSEYCINNRRNFNSGNIYWNRAKANNNPLLNDASTNYRYIWFRDSVYYPLKDEILDHDVSFSQQLEYRELLFHCDQSDAARQARQKILHIMERTQQADIVSALLYRELGIDHLSQSSLNNAIHYFQRSIDDYKQHSENHNDTLLWGNTLYLLGTALERCGKNKEAKNAYASAAKLLEDNSSIEFSHYFAIVALARISNILGEHYSMRKAVGTLETILNRNNSSNIHFDFLPDIGVEYKDKEQVNAIIYASYFHVRALEFERIDIDKAVDYAYFAIQYLEKVKLNDNYFYYQMQLLLARLQLKEKNFISQRLGVVPSPELLLRSCTNAYNEGKTIELPDAAMAYILLAEMSVRERNEKDAIFYFQKAYHTITDYAMQHLFTMTEGNRAKFWEKVKPVLSQIIIDCINNTESITSLAEVALDCSLFMKGLLLQSANELRQIVYESGDRILINRYEQMLHQQETESLNEHLSFHSEELELLSHPLLVAKLEEMKSMVLFNSVQLKKNLKKGEVAIEMIETEKVYEDRSIINKDSQYGAIVVTADEEARYIPLFRGKELSNESNLFSKQLYNLVWKPLEQEIIKNHNIYFSATGLLHNLPIENAVYIEEKFVGQRHALYRMSSLRNLTARSRKSGEKAAIFGGLTYHLRTSTLKEPSNSDANNPVFRDIPNIASLRYAEREIEDLPGTAEEATFLDQLLRKHHIPTSLNEKERGTESAFKQLSGERVTLMHIGTHGFANVEKYGTNDENILLSSCGLLFAGAANTIYSDGLPEGAADDGIVTAREICSLDFRGLDLVILSACKTGLGKTGSDGVFGLQRGFKKAGAKSIIMSLWEVDDKATSFLMAEFYKYWIDKKESKYNALEMAKQAVRSYKEKGWDDPKYWAAFILLDGID